MYDMDNNDPKERPAFERLYGKLPDCVPAAAENTGMRKPVEVRVGVDTGAPRSGASLIGASRGGATVVVHTGEGWKGSAKDFPANVLYVVDGDVRGRIICRTRSYRIRLPR